MVKYLIAVLVITVLIVGLIVALDRKSNEAPVAKPANMALTQNNTPSNQVSDTNNTSVEEDITALDKDLSSLSIEDSSFAGELNNL